VRQFFLNSGLYALAPAQAMYQYALAMGTSLVHIPVHGQIVKYCKNKAIPPAHMGSYCF